MGKMSKNVEKPRAIDSDRRRLLGAAGTAAMIGNQGLLEASINASERTQQWLDAVWNSALQNEGAIT